MTIRILLVDDHALVRQSLRMMLDGRSTLAVVGEAGDGREAVAAALRLRPDVILLDLLMPEMTGVEVIRELKAQGSESRMLVLTSTLADELVQDAVEAGADGYILKVSHTDDLFRAIERVARGESVLDPAALDSVMRGLRRGRQAQDDPLATLTARQRDVFDLVALGHNNHEIATALNLSENTVRTHLAAILDKLALRDRVQVMVFALKRGLVRPDDLP